MSIKTKQHERLSRPLEAVMYNILEAHQAFFDDEEIKAQKHIKRAHTLLCALRKRGFDYNYSRKVYAAVNLLKYVEKTWGLWSIDFEQFNKEKSSVGDTTELGNLELQRS